ncbi:enoyl-CoA hydratase-related protein [Jhaorihella thermophila]|uniref:2-(1,2-epoxy-1,2-dihydrophenyl)acetyl-CoA isomerase n=1 Tax=Jhaorihella thermophila TaxID=488547 RepID=A0A1H5UHD1_9RHOB|nr:enoyl-CoA hydratase-related protein [Jhaorihella thermophila]SEF73888.1 2-(1,2-epoxy-1,2-dihydrophenyl)acetyl-CoA isomerase [Jhaorihella thermophila]
MTQRNWITEARDGAVLVLRMGAPEQLNALHAPMMAQLHDALERAGEDGDVRAVVLTGTGRAFCAGAHVGGMAEMPDKAAGIADLLENGWNRAVRLIRGMPKPVIAAVNGIAAGGGVGLALSADIVLAARSARFIQVFGPRLGVIPDVGCTWFLPRGVGRARALRLMLTGERLAAEQAERWGLIAACVGDADLMRESLALAHRLAAGPIRAFAEIRAAVDHGLSQDLDAALDHERDTNARLCAGPDFAEGTAAFLEKRAADFTNRPLTETKHGHMP